jgi:hypothetical protein
VTGPSRSNVTSLPRRRPARGADGGGGAQEKQKERARERSEREEAVRALEEVAAPEPLMTNKGSDLLRKMGWKDGEGLGANASGPPPPPCLSPRRRAGTRPRRDRAAGASCGSPGLTARSRPAVASRAVALALPRGRRQASRRPWRSRSARSARESAPAQRPRFSAPAAPRRRRGLNPRFARGKLNPRFARGKLNPRFARGKQVENMVQEGDSLATRNRKKVSPPPPPVPTAKRSLHYHPPYRPDATRRRTRALRAASRRGVTRRRGRPQAQQRFESVARQPDWRHSGEM